jgi:hypothetical protein
MTNAELAVLSLLVEQPRHGYEIEQVIDERGMREWTDIGFSSIYYILRKLEKQALVQASVDRAAGRGPSRKVYSPTPAGYAACGQGSLAVLSTLTGGNRPFLLGLNNISGLPPEEALQAVKAYRDELDGKLRQLHDRRDADGPMPWFVDALFDYSVEMLDAERTWVDRFIRTFRTRSGGKVVHMAPKMKPFEPQLVELPSRPMAVVHTVGDPAEVGAKVFPALYGAVYTLKFALKKEGAEFKVEPPRARWLGGPEWASLPREEWKAEWAIPVPEGIAEVVQKDAGTPVTVETWDYGTVAQVLHIGTYAEEEPTIVKLHDYIAEQGYEICGPHEEEYVSRPGAKQQKTVIRYQVRKAQAAPEA